MNIAPFSNHRVWNTHQPWHCEPRRIQPTSALVSCKAPHRFPMFLIDLRLETNKKFSPLNQFLAMNVKRCLWFDRLIFHHPDLCLRFSSYPGLFLGTSERLASNRHAFDHRHLAWISIGWIFDRNSLYRSSNPGEPHGIWFEFHSATPSLYPRCFSRLRRIALSLVCRIRRLVWDILPHKQPEYVRYLDPRSLWNRQPG